VKTLHNFDFTEADVVDAEVGGAVVGRLF